MKNPLRCPHCGSIKIKRVGFVRGPPKEPNKKYSVAYHVYTCLLCNRRFSEPEAQDAYFTAEEKADLVTRLEQKGLKKLATKVEQRQIAIHKKSELGKLYEDIQH